MQAQAFSQEKNPAAAAPQEAHGRDSVLSVVPSRDSQTPGETLTSGPSFRPFRRAANQGYKHRLNLPALAATGLIHLVVGAALLLQWQLHKAQAPDPILFVQITEQKAEKPIETPPLPKFEAPKVDVPLFQLPDIPKQTNAITPPPQPRVATTPPAAPDVKVVETYQLKLMRHLNAYKRYPRVQEARGETGTAFLHFVLDRQGSVLSFRITRSSGNAALDAATLDMIQRASPVPVPPSEIWRDPMEIELPISYEPRR